jgi:tetratricopeptide (TPR) repeat protein
MGIRTSEAIMSTASLDLASGWEHQRAGRYAQAEQYYRRVVQTEPNHAEAWYFVGVTCFRQGRTVEAQACYERSLALRPNHADALNNLGVALAVQGRFMEAEARFRQSLRVKPDYGDALRNLGKALRDQRKLADAAESFRGALRLNAGDGELHAVLGTTLLEADQLEPCVASFEEALKLRPADVGSLQGMGVALAKLKRHDEAIACFRKALRLDPNLAGAHNSLGVALAEQKRHDEAITCFREALRLQPNFAEALGNLGNALRNMDRFDEAIAAYERALEVKPDHAETHNNLGIALATLGKWTEAIAAYDRALEIEPDHVNAHRNRALAWLTIGQYESGWSEYEWRWRGKDLRRPEFTQPLWKGEPLAGRTILLQAEQGLGDTIQFIRYAALVHERGGRVVFQCQKPLVRVLEGVQGIDELVPAGGPLPAFDVHAPLISLPGLFGTTTETVPAVIPYVQVDRAAAERWRERLGGDGEVLVGVCWQGNPAFPSDRHRSFRLVELDRAARVPGVRLVSLQKEFGLEQLRDVAGRFEIVDLGEELDRESGPFVDTAALLSVLDVVVTPDTSIVHLAGALGARTWLALSVAGDWRWLAGRTDSPWYPSVRVFRQPELGRWGPVFGAMADELGRLAAGRGGSRPITVEIAAGELIDKIAILTIKAGRIGDPGKLRHVRAELAMLHEARNRVRGDWSDLESVEAGLRLVNEELWDVEDELRTCELRGEFGDRFVELARSVYRLNDRRASLKRAINERVGSRIVEEKSYA